MTTHQWSQKTAIPKRIFIEMRRSGKGEISMAMLAQRHTSGWEGHVAWRQEATVASRGRRRLGSVNLPLPLLSLSLSRAVVLLLNKNQICFQPGKFNLDLISTLSVCFRFDLTWKLVILNFLIKKWHIIEKCQVIVSLITKVTLLTKD